MAVYNYMATIKYACSDWLFSFNYQALLARCPRHIQFVFNLMVDIHVMVKFDSCPKGYPLKSVTWLYHKLKCTTHWRAGFFKAICWPVVGFHWMQAQVHNQYMSYFIINNLPVLVLSVRSFKENFRLRSEISL